ncbi:MAG: hypothetical protein WKF71_17580 [Pyrinomonadaceae bacterium]
MTTGFSSFGKRDVYFELPQIRIYPFELGTQAACVFRIVFRCAGFVDEFDASTADTLCDTDLAAVGLQCTLRAAVQQANALSSNDRTLFSLPANSIITLTIANGGEIPIEDNGTLEIVGTGSKQSDN